ncbi:hypothetical protein T492DRAFT_858485 [Pavlovales sp. CCMP2436]|nr:hypothetical protein T492DRAFT_858485 [Pavlovales sp. CCMP2436]
MAAQARALKNHKRVAHSYYALEGPLPVARPSSADAEACHCHIGPWPPAGIDLEVAETKAAQLLAPYGDLARIVPRCFRSSCLMLQLFHLHDL